MSRKLQVYRRNTDGREFIASEDTAELSKDGRFRLIEIEIDGKGHRVGEVDLSRLDSEGTDKALREAIARKFPHVFPLLDFPDVAKMAVAVLNDKKAKGEVTEPVADMPDEPVAQEPPVPDNLDKDEPLNEAPPETTEDSSADDGEEKPLTERERKIQAFTEKMRNAPGRKGKQELAAEFDIKIAQGSAADMVNQAVEAYTEMLPEGT